ncbi:hypothetical protein [Selenomonas sp. AB3002]|uniref:hypothetical protein n=1 Tax=Selenomonas sp. AB3002 TaxID=1392502 RepID=UPI00049501BF
MATSEAQKRATAKYQRNLASVTFRIKREELERYKATAEKMGLSFRAYILLGMERLAKENDLH